MAEQFIGYLSKGISRIPNLASFFSKKTIFAKKVVPEQLKCIVGWGRKETSDVARNYAKQHNIPFVSLEDGFIRSLGLAAQSDVQHSLIVDNVGIYYDATQTSDLELLILKSELLDESELLRASHCINQLKKYRLSKYNHAPDRPLSLGANKYRVLVVDQTKGDASVNYGMADQNTFCRMLDAAIFEHPDAEIVVKIHPDVVSGKKQGYLLEAIRNKTCIVLSEQINPWSVLDSISHVYTVTSQFGFEALFAGKVVTCFGMPFYAGWGLTNDRVECERRGTARSLEQIFFAAYIQYSRYINPYTGESCSIENTIRILATQKTQYERHRGLWVAVDFSGWKRKFIPDYLGSAAQVKFIKYKVKKTKNLQHILVWSSKLSESLENYCLKHKLPLWRMEDGFIRSVGLGTDFVRPVSLVIDSCGIYYDATRPSDLEVLLNTFQFDESILSRAKKIRQQLVELQITKYNVGGTLEVELPNDKRIILVPGQVESDASISKGSPQIKTNLALLKQVRVDNPDAFIIYKPHPDVSSGARVGLINNSAEDIYNLEVTNISISALFNKVDEVHTLSSLTGFEALVHGLKVVTYGIPFYAGWGLTTDRLTCTRRTRKSSIEQLIAATLILYPIYVDPESGDIIDVETAITLLNRQRTNSKPPSPMIAMYRTIRNKILIR